MDDDSGGNRGTFDNQSRFQSNNKSKSNMKSNKLNNNNSNKSNNNNNNNSPETISTALATLERDMLLLDNLASSQPQLSLTEVGLLMGSVVMSGVGPMIGGSVTEVLAPAMAACE